MSKNNPLICHIETDMCETTDETAKSTSKNPVSSNKKPI